MKKTIVITVLLLAAVAAAGYFFFLKPPPEPEVAFYPPGESFVTNIRDSQRLLKVTVVLEVLSTDTEELLLHLKDNNHIIRDVIVFTLREKTEDELRAMGVEDELREEIKSNLVDQMGMEELQKVYFNDFVIQ